MAFKYKVAVLGPIPRDHITNFRGEVIEKYGGINNPAIALAKILGDESIIYPVAHVRKKDEKAIKKILQKYSNINLDYINSNADHGDVNRLRFIDQNNRLEKMSGFMNPIIPDDIKTLLDCDIFVILPVTEFEIALETLKFIKKYSSALVIFDAHGPTTMMTALGDRLMKFWIDRDSWLPYIDVLKMNLDEAKCSWFRKKYTLSELENNYEFGFNDLRPFANHCLSMGVKVLCVTLDGRGCVIYFKENSTTPERIVPAVKVGKVVDTTGCGDSFAGGFAFGLLTSGDYIKAAQYANVLGAQRTQGKTFDVFKSFTETEQMRRKTYGEEEEVS